MTGLGFTGGLTDEAGLTSCEAIVDMPDVTGLGITCGGSGLTDEVTSCKARGDVSGLTGLGFTGGGGGGFGFFITSDF